MKTNALSFYGSKMILDRPNNFGRVPIVLHKSNSFWSGPNHFGQVQIIKISPEKYNLDPTKTIWTVQNHFRSIEGQGIKDTAEVDTDRVHIVSESYFWSSWTRFINLIIFHNSECHILPPVYGFLIILCIC